MTCSFISFTCIYFRLSFIPIIMDIGSYRKLLSFPGSKVTVSGLAFGEILSHTTAFLCRTMSFCQTFSTFQNWVTNSIIIASINKAHTVPFSPHIPGLLNGCHGHVSMSTLLCIKSNNVLQLMIS